MKNRSILVALLGLIMAVVPTAAQAEPMTVRGTVTDEHGETLIGAIVVSKKTEKGDVLQSAVTDGQGNYVIECHPGEILVSYFLGYDDTVVQVGKGNVVDIVMQPAASTRLDEAVVIGYGSVKKSDLTGSVANVNMGDLRNEPVSSVDQALQGRVAGAEIMATGGEPGAATSIRIRGTRSISASNEPLIVVDGVMDAVTDLGDINPADIESISILKDASSTAIYGARGSNGVILVQTKEASNQAGTVSVTLRSGVGFSALPRKLDLMNAYEFSNYWNDYATLGTSYASMSTTTPVSEMAVSDPTAFGVGTDWIGEVTRVAPWQNHNLVVSGMAGKIKYRGSIAYNDNRGIIKNSGERKVVGSLNVSTELFKWLEVGFKFNHTWRNTDENLASIGGTSLYNSVIYLSPLMEPYATTNPLNFTSAKITLPTWQIDCSTKNTERNMTTVTVFANFKIGKQLVLRTQGSYFRHDRNKWQYFPSTLPSREDGQGGQAYRQYYTENKFNVDNTLTWTMKKTNRHSFTAMAGMTFYDFTSSTLQLSGQGYLVDDVKWKNMGAVQDKNTYSAYTNEIKKRTLSFFARASYDYDKRYYLTVTARTDGASNFAENRKWGFFPSLALRWNIHKEAFMRHATWVDELSLKLSAGRSGNDAIPTYRSMPTLTSSTSGYLFDGIQSVAYYPSRLASPDLRWETTDLYNVSLTASLLNSRLNITAEAYVAYTRDLLLDVQVAEQSGYASRLMNIGRTSNKGLELSIESRNIVTRNFSWTTAFTISHNKQLVEDIGSENYIIAYAAPVTGYMMYGYMKGYPLNALWGFQGAGVWHNEEEIKRNDVTHAVAARNGSRELGMPVYIDQNHDGLLNDKDITYLGNADPYIYGGLQNTFRISKFNIGIYLAYSLGGKIYNYSELFMSGSRRTNQYRYMLNAWHPIKNPDSDLPRAGIMDEDLNGTRQIHDASYLRLKTVSVGYTWNLKKKWLKDITFTVSGENLWLWKKYNGFDPDVSTSSEGSTIRRMDLGAYPRAMTVVGTIQIRY